MAEAVKRRYDNSRRLAQVRATRAKVIDAAKQLFIEHGYPATTLEAVADAADVALPTLYRLFGSKRALLKEVLDTSLSGDDQPGRALSSLLRPQPVQHRKSARALG